MNFFQLCFYLDFFFILIFVLSVWFHHQGNGSRLKPLLHSHNNNNNNNFPSFSTISSSSFPEVDIEEKKQQKGLKRSSIFFRMDTQHKLFSAVALSKRKAIERRQRQNE